MKMLKIENQQTRQSSVSQSRTHQKPIQQFNRHSIQEVTMELESLNQNEKALAKSFMDWNQDDKKTYRRWKTNLDKQPPGTEEIEGKGRASMMLKSEEELQLHYFNLKVAPLINQEQFTAELVKEKETNRLLLLENQRIIASYLQEKNMYQHQLTALRQQVDSLQQRIHTGVMEHKPVWQYSGDLQGQQRHILGNVFCQPMKTNKGYELQTLGKDVRFQAESFQQQLEKEKVNHQETVKNAWCTINRERAEKEALQKRLSEMEIIFATQQRTQQNVQVPNQDLSSHKKNHVSPMRNAKRKRGMKLKTHTKKMNSKRRRSARARKPGLMLTTLETRRRLETLTGILRRPRHLQPGVSRRLKLEANLGSGWLLHKLNYTRK